MKMEMDMETQAHSEASASAEPAPDSPTSSPLVFTGKIFRAQRGRKTTFQRSKPRKPPKTQSKPETDETDESNPIPLAYTLAFAHHMEQLIESGEVANRAELARIFGLSRARVTQILNLTLLAPDIQEGILFAETSANNDGAEIITERSIRKLTRTLAWANQREMWGGGTI